MKRLLLVLLLMLALIGVSAVASAQDLNPAGMAKYFPAETELFAAIRTDEAFLDELDVIVTTLRDKFPAALNIPRLGIRNLIQSSLGPIQLSDIRAWLGDYAAIALPDLAAAAPRRADGDSRGQTPGYIAVAITDKAATEAFFLNMMPAFAENTVKSEENSFTVYRSNRPDSPGFAAFGEDVLIISVSSNDLPAGGLDSSPRFTVALAKLPEASYHALVYVDAANLMRVSMEAMPQAAEAMQTMNLDLSSLNPAVIGFTVLDGNSLVVDSVSPGIAGMMPALKEINPEFARHIPGTFSFVMQSSGLATVVNMALDTFVKASAMGDNPMTRPQIADLIRGFTQIDLDADLLSWMNSDFALLFDVDMLPVLDALAAGEAPETLPVNFGLVFDVSGSAAAAKTFVEKFGQLALRQAEQMQQSGVTVSISDIAALPMVIIEGVTLSRSPDITTDIILGANDDVFVLADRATAETIFGGDFTSLADNPAFAAAGQSMLPNPVGMLYLDGTFFGDLVALGGTAFMASSARRPGDTTTDNTAQIVEMLRFGYDLFSSASATVTMLPDGDTLSRGILTLK